MQNPQILDMQSPQSPDVDERSLSPEFLEILVTSSRNLQRTREVCIMNLEIQKLVLINIVIILQRDALLMNDSDETNIASDCSSTSSASSSLLVPIPPQTNKITKNNCPHHFWSITKELYNRL